MWAVLREHERRMAMRTRTIAFVALVAACLAALSPAQVAAGGRGHWRHRHHPHLVWALPLVLLPFWDREVVGTVIGGAAGGLLGSGIGRGSGRVAAIVGGTLVGALVGGSLGRDLDAADRAHVARALEYVPSRQATAWQNPDRDATYQVTPLDTWQGPDGRYCREFQTTAIVGGERQELYGTACRQPDGSWEMLR
jgi:surface antigen